MTHPSIPSAARFARGVSLALACLSLAPLAAQASGDGKDKYYLGAHLGRNALDSWPATVDFGAGVRASGALSLDSGGHYGLMFGRRTENARFELEYQRGDLGLRGVRVNTGSQSASGRIRYDALTVNAYRTHTFSASWNGYAGVGVGWGSVDLPTASFGVSCKCFPSTSDSGLLYQGRLGLEYAVASQHKLFAQYTWLRLPGADSGNVVPGVEYSRRSLGALSVGYRKDF